MTDDPMSRPPGHDHGSDRYDYVELEAPPSVSAPDHTLARWFAALLDAACADCRANVFLRWIGADPSRHNERESWHVTVAHDETCPHGRAHVERER